MIEIKHDETDAVLHTVADDSLSVLDLLAEIARMRAVIETWREAHIEATGTDQ